VVKISPEWVTGPEQGKSSGRVATFSLWTGVFRDGISSIPDKTVIQYSALRLFLAGIRTQSGHRYGSGTLHSGHILRGRLPLLSNIRKENGNKAGDVLYV
jgi:hypothetical protein